MNDLTFDATFVRLLRSKQATYKPFDAHSVNMRQRNAESSSERKSNQRKHTHTHTPTDRNLAGLI